MQRTWFYKVKIININGSDYRVQPRKNLPPLIYKRYKTGIYYRWRLIWPAKGYPKIPKLNSKIARILAAANES